MSASRPTIVQVLSMYHPEGERILQTGAEVIRTEYVSSEQLCETVRETNPDALLIRAPARITKQVIDAAPALRVLSGAGVGLDNIDVDYASTRGIPVLHAPSVNQIATAEHAVMLIMAASKSLIPFHEAMRRGEFAARMTIPSSELRGKRVGLVGFGHIAQETAKMLRFGFSMEVTAWLRSPNEAKLATAHKLETKLTSDLSRLFTESDFVSLHIPLTQATKAMIDRRYLHLMKPTAWLINTARGGVVAEADLIEALRSRRLAGAAIDCFEPEPPPADHPLLSLDNVILTPHVGGITQESNYVMATTVARNLLRVLSGERVDTIGNPQVWQS
ncbi:MAG: hydroxyacid dehydrogenase [Paenibacillus sp.]|nr:hydroxyacid dehydrogenase [Paenibacillus sp.]